MARYIEINDDRGDLADLVAFCSDGCREEGRDNLLRAGLHPDADFVMSDPWIEGGDSPEWCANCGERCWEGLQTECDATCLPLAGGWMAVEGTECPHGYPYNVPPRDNAGLPPALRTASRTASGDLFVLRSMEACEPESLEAPAGIWVVVWGDSDTAGIDWTYDSHGCSAVDIYGRSPAAVTDYVRSEWGDDDKEWFGRYVVPRVERVDARDLYDAIEDAEGNGGRLVGDRPRTSSVRTAEYDLEKHRAEIEAMGDDDWLGPECGKCGGVIWKQKGRKATCKKCKAVRKLDGDYNFSSRTASGSCRVCGESILAGDEAFSPGSSGWSRYLRPGEATGTDMGSGHPDWWDSCALCAAESEAMMGHHRHLRRQYGVGDPDACFGCAEGDDGLTTHDFGWGCEHGKGRSAGRTASAPLDALLSRYVATDEGAVFLEAAREAEDGGEYDSDRDSWEETFDQLQDGFVEWAEAQGETLNLEDGSVADAIWNRIL